MYRSLTNNALEALKKTGKIPRVGVMKSDAVFFESNVGSFRRLSSMLRTAGSVGLAESKAIEAQNGLKQLIEILESRAGFLDGRSPLNKKDPAHNTIAELMEELRLSDKVSPP